MRTKEQAIAYYEANRGRYYELHKAKKAKYRSEYREYMLTQECVECGENHPACLDWHHVDPDLKEYNIATKAGCITLATLMLEINKCICLCANCHRKLHA